VCVNLKEKIENTASILLDRGKLSHKMSINNLREREKGREEKKFRESIYVCVCE
jgi:hypothetical protein